MRPTLVLAAAILAAAGSAAVAQAATPAPPAAVPAPPPPPEAAPPTDTTPSASAAELEAFNTRIEADEATLTRLRDADLARGNALIVSLKPALPFTDRWHFLELPAEHDARGWPKIYFPGL